MASDRARITYDPSRQYRSVVMQQGRVTLEADVNEAQDIAGELLREETLDIVGPAGTPDNGYEIDGKTVSGDPFDFHIEPGTMYVGGERVFLPTGIDFSTQPEWLDHKFDPLFFGSFLGNEVGPGNELVELFLREQEVSAVEDTPLREVALGGPDTAQRMRLIQRILRLPVDSDTCQDADAETAKKWANLGVDFDSATMRLLSPATMQVNFAEQQPSNNPCDPPVQSGYLGADNQLIRVQITAFDPKTNKGRFVWGFNNSSFFYRVKAVDAQTLELQSSPVDSYHSPRPNKAIEVLRTAVSLGHDDFIASHAGVIQTPTQAYVPETHRLALPAALPPEYLNATDSPQLFMRLWESEVDFTGGVAVDLVGTGLQVTIKLNGEFGFLTIGQYWMFAVRPSTPVQLYQQRYLDAPQPPDGPRMWVCPLAVIDWPQAQFHLIEDCRNPFDNLVELTKNKAECCSIVMTPDDVQKAGGLQAVINAHQNQRATISLKPGTYKLALPLRINNANAGLVLEGCQDGVVLSADANENFLHGMVLLNQVSSVTLRNLSFGIPLVPFTGDQAKMAGLKAQQLGSFKGPDITKLHAGIAVRVLQSNRLLVDQCAFHFQQPPETPIFEAGILANGQCNNLEVTNCRFIHAPIKTEPASIRIGILMTPATAVTGLHSPSSTGLSTTQGFVVDAQILPAQSTNLKIYDNQFSGLDAAGLIYGNMGAVRLEENTIEDCYAGFWFFSLRSLAFMEQIFSKSGQIAVRYKPLPTDHVLTQGAAFARGFPLPPAFDAVAAGAKPVKNVTWIPKNPPAGTDLMQRGFILNELLSTMEQGMFSKLQNPLPLAMMVTGNQIDALEIVNTQTPTPVGVRLLVWNDDQDTFGSVVINANQIRNQTQQHPLPTVGVVLAARCTVTGNVIMNELEGSDKVSLSIITSISNLTSNDPEAQVAVTGNVFRGNIDVPPHKQAPAPMDNWRFFNMIAF